MAHAEAAACRKQHAVTITKRRGVARPAALSHTSIEEMARRTLRLLLSDSTPFTGQHHRFLLLGAPVSPKMSSKLFKGSCLATTGFAPAGATPAGNGSASRPSWTE